MDIKTGVKMLTGEGNGDGNDAFCFNGVSRPTGHFGVANSLCILNHAEVFYEAQATSPVVETPPKLCHSS